MCKISLHTVLFNRWLGEMNFKDTESTIPNIYYVNYWSIIKTQLDDAAIEKDINSQIEILSKFLEEKKLSKVFLSNIYRLF